MADIRTRFAFGFPIADLKVYCRRFDLALVDESIGDEVRKHLPPDFPHRFAARMARLDELESLHVAAIGRAADLTAAKRSAQADVILLSGSARAAARVVFARNAPVLHGEFFVGGGWSKSVATLLANAGKLVASCTTHAAALAEAGWSAEETQLLDRAVDRLGRADTDRETATDVKEGCTAEQTAVCNELYRMCRAIQNVARVVYARKYAMENPAIVTGRARFMLGEFPPRPGTKPIAPEEPVADTPAAAVAAREPAAATPTPASTAIEANFGSHSASDDVGHDLPHAPPQASPPPGAQTAQNNVKNGRPPTVTQGYQSFN